MYYNCRAGIAVAVKLDWYSRVNYFSDYRIKFEITYETKPSTYSDLEHTKMKLHSLQCRIMDALLNLNTSFSVVLYWYQSNIVHELYYIL